MGNVSSINGTPVEPAAPEKTLDELVAEYAVRRGEFLVAQRLANEAHEALHVVLHRRLDVAATKALLETFGPPVNAPVGIA